MDKRTAIKVYKVMSEVAAEKIRRAARLADRIISDEAWIAFDKAANEASLFMINALCSVPDGFLPEEDERRLHASLREMAALRIRIWENWQILWREQQAIVNPTGKYGVMRAEREALTTMLQDGDDDGNGHHGSKP